MSRRVNPGKLKSEETKKKIGNSQRGVPKSDEFKEKCRIRMTGRPSFMKGRKQTEYQKSVMRSKSGENHYNWQGGKSFEQYPIDWRRTLRIAVRERDNYMCQLCGRLQGDEALSVHHIDYDKKNCNTDNLISLCRTCHTKTNFNRNYWSDFFKRTA